MHGYVARRNGRMSPMAPIETPTTGPERGDPRMAFTNLLKKARAELGEGLNKVAARCVDPVTGMSMKKGRIYRLEGAERGGITPPHVWELRALEVGYRVSLARLQDAAGSQFHGRDPLRSGSGTGEAVAYVRKLDSLSDEQRENLFRLIDSMVPPPESEDH
ncbi:hypothetical protein ABZX85_41610 [Streptomyces sp. NPDC004539]|uniref:hypothetical protein n=1 Tax=Streptomyces sp. NPDC004539 TaxID=3154280 RepID=UPI0033B16864